MSPAAVALARFAHGLDVIPDEVQRAALEVLRHNVVVALAARDSVDSGGRDGELWPAGLPVDASGTRIRDGHRVPAERAIVANSLLMGARAQHDEVPRAVSHFGSTVIPPLLAIAEAHRVSGQDFLIALVAGYEVGERVGAAYVSAAASRGFRPTGLFGPVAGAAAGARALGLSERATTSAIALAANMSAGLSETWRAGTDEWRYQTALAARSAYTAATLAEAGVSGSVDTFEAPNGFARAFTGTDTAIDGSDLGRRWCMHEVILKPYPVCVFNQAVVEQIVNVRPEVSGQLDEIRVHMNPADAQYPGVDAPDPPPTRAAALMSAQICAAIAFRRGTVDLEDLESSGDPQLREMARLVRVVPDSDVPSHGARVQIRTSAGLFGLPTPALVASDTAARRAICARLAPKTGLSDTEFERLMAAVDSLPSAKDVTGLLSAMALGE